MTTIAVIALVLAVGVGTKRRANRLRRIALAYSVEANRWANRLIGPSGTSKDGPSGREADEIWDGVHWNDTVAGHFELAAERPWIIADPDPRKIDCKCGHHSR